MVNQTASVAIADIARRAKLEEGVLVTRAYGRVFMRALEHVLSEHAEASTIILDFTGVAILDASFADEVFGNFATQRARRQRSGPCVGLRGLSPSNLENLEMALASRPIREPGLRNCVLPIIGIQGEVALLGKVETYIVDTFEFLKKYKSCTARELADELELDIGAASTRLKGVADLGLAYRIETRDAHGKQFVYQWAF